MSADISARIWPVAKKTNLGTDSWLEQVLDELDVLVLDGDDQPGPAERVDAVDVEDALLLAQGRHDSLDGSEIAPLDVEQEELEISKVRFRIYDTI